jgi:hypothetical protein
VLTQRAILAVTKVFFYPIAPKQHQEIPDDNIGSFLLLLFCGMTRLQ